MWLESCGQRFTEACTTGKKRDPVSKRGGPAGVGSIVKRYRKRDKQYTYGLRIRAYGERYWVPLGTECEGWNDVRAADRGDQIAALISRGAWQPADSFQLDPRETDPGFREFASDRLKRYRRTVDATTADTAEYMLSHQLLLFLHTYRLSEVTYSVLASYVANKLERSEEIEAARDAGVTLRDSQARARKPLSARTINMTLDLAARILKDAVKRGLLQSKHAGERPRPAAEGLATHGNFLEADELLALFHAA